MRLNRIIILPLVFALGFFIGGAGVPWLSARWGWGELETTVKDSRQRVRYESLTLNVPLGFSVSSMSPNLTMSDGERNEIVEVRATPLSDLTAQSLEAWVKTEGEGKAMFSSTVAGQAAWTYYVPQTDFPGDQFGTHTIFNYGEQRYEISTRGYPMQFHYHVLDTVIVGG